jgi:hypothetical protein
MSYDSWKSEEREDVTPADWSAWESRWEPEEELPWLEELDDDEPAPSLEELRRW